MENKEIISRKDFKHLNKLHNKQEFILDFFKSNIDKAYHFNYLLNKFKIKRTSLYHYLHNLLLLKQIEKSGKYYMIADKDNM